MSIARVVNLARFPEKLAVHSVSTLAEAAGILISPLIVVPTDSNTDECFDQLHSADVDFSDVRVQEFAKRALVTAASGGHSVPKFWTIPRRFARSSMLAKPPAMKSDRYRSRP